MNKLFSYIAIPATDFERAFAFYDSVTEAAIQRNPNVPFPMGYFTDKDGKDIGHLFQHDQFKPSADGVIVYFEAEDINETLQKIETAGGKIIMPKTLIGPGKGYWALFADTEGNKLALHSLE